MKKLAGKAAHHGPLPDRAVAAIYDALAKSIDPRCELEFSSPFQLLIAVILSAQATDRSVNAATKTLFTVAPTPAAMLALGVDGLKPYIRTIGLFNTKAANVIATCQALIDRHGGEVPSDRAALEAMPGVGRKTANVVLNIAFGQPTIAVDTHVHRVANRLGIAVSTTPEQTETVLLTRTPKQHLQHAHHYLILHGRYTCVARAPKCDGCPVQTWCSFATPKSCP